MCSQKSLPSKHDIPYFICTGSLAIKPPRQKQLRKNAWQPQTPMREVCTRICSFVTGQANIPIVKIFTASGTLRFLKAFVRKNRDARLLRAGAATLGLHVFTFNVRMSCLHLSARSLIDINSDLCFQRLGWPFPFVLFFNVEAPASNCTSC